MDEDSYIENSTQYGEFVCSFDKWLPIEKQKSRAEKLAHVTNKTKRKEKRRLSEKKY